MQFYDYKGFTIYPTPRLSMENDTWKICLTIRRGNKVKSFAADNFFMTKGEATFQSVHFGKKIIDEEIPGYSITDILL